MDRFVHITGSVPRRAGPETMELAERTAYETARSLLRAKIGLVALVGASTNDGSMAFDDAIVRAAADHCRETGDPGIVIKTVRHRTRWAERISAATRANLTLLDNRVADEALPDDGYTGGAIRAAQARQSDGAIVIGGYRGVKETADLLMNERPPKPIDEIFIKGLDGGLPEDIRDQIDASRDWDSHADLRTVMPETDCARIAHRVATDMADRLRPVNEASKAVPGNSLSNADEPAKSKPKMWYSLTIGQLSAWVGNGLSAIRIWLGSNGGG